MLNYKRTPDMVLERKSENIDISQVINMKLSENKTDNLINDTIQIQRGSENIKEIVNNHHNINHHDSKIIVETDFTNKTFTFYDSNKNLLGSFNIYEFIKFITSNASNNFLITVSSTTVKPLIEKYICNLSYTDTSKKYNINMLNWLDSPFMGNIDTLVKLYLLINTFEKKELQYELTKLNEQERINVSDIYNDLLYNLISHILKVISILNGKLIDSSKIKGELLQYSISMVHRLSRIIKNDLEKKHNNIEILKQNLEHIKSEKRTMNTRLTQLENKNINSISSNNSNIIDRLVTSTSDNNIQTITDESEIYDIKTDGDYIKYKNTESATNNNNNNDLTYSELVNAVDKIRSSSANISNKTSPNNKASSLMDMISLNNSISNQSSDNFFHSEGNGNVKHINYLSSNVL